MSQSCQQIGESAILAARILVVDDDHRNLEIAREILSKKGFINLRLESDSVTALQWLVDEQEFDLMLIDLMMPRMDGFEFLEHLCAMGITTPVLVITARRDDASIRRAFAAKARDYIIKPFKGDELIARARSQIIAHLAQRQLAIENQNLEATVRCRTAALQSAQHEIVQRLGRAGEFRDNETGMHVIRMARFSRLVALGFGMSEDEAELLLQAAPMHDIGKIGISDRILLKPGRLDAEERKIMNTHAAIGAEILGGSDIHLLQAASQIAHSHHEKWDGSGYPQQLVGPAIPLCGRIVAIADVFDALTSERPYKKAWPVEEAVAFILDQAGQHFDPQLVNVFQSVLPQIRAAREQLLDKMEEQT